LLKMVLSKDLSKDQGQQGVTEATVCVYLPLKNSFDFHMPIPPFFPCELIHSFVCFFNLALKDEFCFLWHVSIFLT
jgi:hypothetical protein